MQTFIQTPKQIIKTTHREINCFPVDQGNIDLSVVESFGEEWLKFHGFSDQEIDQLGNSYFDIVNESILNKHSIVLDAGCGSGRFSKYIATKVGFVEAIDPSDAVFAADSLLQGMDNIRISKASISNIPFADNSFDMVMSIGVLHHIPNTKEAMASCIQKVKPGGYFYTYLYYALDNRGFFFKMLYAIAHVFRLGISRLPSKLKKLVCDFIAILFYMPFILLGRLLKVFGMKTLAAKLPLSFYQDHHFMIVRNDALDRFGTSLEQRFSKKEIIAMMTELGLQNIVVSPGLPYWHALGKKPI